MSGAIGMMMEGGRKCSDGQMRVILDDLESSELRNKFQYISLALPMNDESQEDEALKNDGNVEEQVGESIENNTAMENPYYNQPTANPYYNQPAAK